MKEIAIIGAGGHGKVLADIAEKNGYTQIVFLDDNRNIKECGGHPVIGGIGQIAHLKCSAALGIGNAMIRERIFKQLKALNIELPPLIHPNAVISDDVTIGEGTVVMAGSVINTGTSIGKGCIINTCSSVDHDCTVGDFVHISVGSHIAGTVHIGVKTWIGIGVSVSNNLDICSDCMIGAGAVILRDIVEQGT